MAGGAVAARARVAMVAPQRLLIVPGAAAMRAAPADDAELVNEVHHAEEVTLLLRRSGWIYAQADDHYFGWLREAVAMPLAGRATWRMVGVPLADVHERPDPASPVVDRLPAGAWLPAETRLDKAGWKWSPRGWVALDATVDQGALPHRGPTADDLIATAEAFLGVPYLWGGTTALGIDCSGLVQQVYRLNGVRLDRDADQQAMEGREVEAPRAGDLLFYGDERVTHVALATSERAFIHAPQAGAHVERGELPAAGRTLRAVRRYLAPSEDEAR